MSQSVATAERIVKRPEGMTAFTIIWFGQLISMLGTGMSRFALTIFAWELTGEATALAMVGFFSFGPTVLLSPFAGAIVDRANRKLVLMLSDLAAGLMTIVVLGLFITDQLQIWHLYLTGAFAGAFESFQFPAYSAAVTVMLPKEQYARASGMHSLVHSASGIGAPILAGALIGLVGIGGILTLDILTFVIAILTLFTVFIPQPERSEEARAGQGSLWKEAGYGFRFILDRPSLLGLQLIFFVINFVASFSIILLAPMVLARTGDNELALGTVMTFFGIGGVVGGVLLSVWGGPRRKIHGILVGMTLSSLLGLGLLGIGREVVVWAAGGFLTSFFLPIINGSSQAIWQSKVAADVQGRVFAVRRLIAQITAPLAFLLAGPLADRVFEPAMQPGGSLEPALGNLVGSGTGAGIALIFLVTGILGAGVSLAGYLFPAVREAEDRLPDHDVMLAHA
jgi:DHA3 family macrolide efflux protein-like MFS transporter